MYVYKINRALTADERARATRAGWLRAGRWKLCKSHTQEALFSIALPLPDLHIAPRISRVATHRALL